MEPRRRLPLGSRYRADLRSVVLGPAGISRYCLEGVFSETAGFRYLLFPETRRFRACLPDPSDEKVRLTTATRRLRSSTLTNPTKVAPRKRLNVSHSACNTTAVAKAPTTLLFNTGCPLRSRSRQSTAHTNPVHAACPAGDVSPRASSTSSSTTRFPPDWSSVTNP